MERFTDIHTHILPGVDDGAENMRKSLELIRFAYENGTRTIFLTPHSSGVYRNNTSDALQKAFSEFQKEALAKYPDMTFLLGSEVRYQNDAPANIAEGKYLTLADSKYVLLEYQNHVTRSEILIGTAEIVRYGFIPILAHVERYKVCRENEELIDDLLDMGVLLQINADSVLGKNGFRIKHFCGRLLKAGCVHFIASDAHNARKRPPLLRECYLYVQKRYGSAYANRLFSQNTKYVIENIEM